MTIKGDTQWRWNISSSLCQIMLIIFITYFILSLLSFIVCWTKAAPSSFHLFIISSNKNIAGKYVQTSTKRFCASLSVFVNQLPDHTFIISATNCDIWAIISWYHTVFMGRYSLFEQYMWVRWSYQHWMCSMSSVWFTQDYYGPKNESGCLLAVSGSL